MVFGDSNVSTSPWYRLTTWGVYYEDTGVQAVRLLAELNADIFATDAVTFEINFRPGNKGYATDIASIGEDTVTCAMTRKTSDGAFWSANVSDGYSLCKGANVKNRCFPELDTGGALVSEPYYYRDESNKYDALTEPQSDWATPFDDDDPDDFWCTKVNTTKGAALSPFECSKLRCYMERPIAGSDSTKDLDFTPTATTADTMVIQPGRAKVFINSSVANFNLPAMNDAMATEMSLSVPLKATFYTVSLATAAAALATLMF